MTEQADEKPDVGADVAAQGEAGDETAQEAQEAELEQLRAEAGEFRDKYLRAVAELDNIRKRGAREVENARKYGVERFADATLTVRDTLEAALNSENVDVATVLEGTQATLRLLDDALEQAGISVIDPAGEPFDPQLHEAMAMQPSETAEPGSVVEVFQKGFRLHDRLLRPARVVVAQEPTESGG